MSGSTLSACVCVGTIIACSLLGIGYVVLGLVLLCAAEYVAQEHIGVGLIDRLEKRIDRRGPQ